MKEVVKEVESPKEETPGRIGSRFVWRSRENKSNPPLDVLCEIKFSRVLIREVSGEKRYDVIFDLRCDAELINVVVVDEDLNNIDDIRAKAKWRHAYLNKGPCNIIETKHSRGTIEYNADCIVPHKFLSKDSLERGESLK